jgi:hypothetical protein
VLGLRDIVAQTAQMAVRAKLEEGVEDADKSGR